MIAAVASLYFDRDDAKITKGINLQVPCFAACAWLRGGKSRAYSQPICVSLLSRLLTFLLPALLRESAEERPLHRCVRACVQSPIEGKPRLYPTSHLSPVVTHT